MDDTQILQLGKAKEVEVVLSSCEVVVPSSCGVVVDLDVSLMVVACSCTLDASYVEGDPSYVEEVPSYVVVVPLGLEDPYGVVYLPYAMNIP